MQASDPTLRSSAPVFTAAPPSRAQKVLAFGVIPAALAVLFLATRPVASVQLPPVEPFVSFYVTAMFVTDLVTAVILFSQFSIQRATGLLVIANGYLFAALVLIPYVAAFPGLFGRGEVLVGGLQSTAWIYILRHCCLAAFMAVFGALSDDIKIQDTGRPVIRLSILGTLALVLAIGILCIGGHFYLPIVASNSLRFGGTWFVYAGLPMAVLYGLAMVSLWPRRRTILGLWLLVVALVHFTGIPLAFFSSPSRFSVGWYTVVIVNFVANSLVLIVLLVEVSNLYARVLAAVRAQQREREARLFTGDTVAAMIAHEVKQPLAAMITRAETSLRRLEKSEPDIEKAKDDIRQIAANGYRAAEVIDGIRADFKKGGHASVSVAINDLISDTIQLVVDELQKRKIMLKVETGVPPSAVSGDRTQLQQVLLNLVNNAAESMGSAAGPHVLVVKSETPGGNDVVVSVADSGSGVHPHDVERIFNPLFTTKAAGMGMGLAICRSIVEAHGGSIWVSQNAPKGAVFHVSLPRLQP